MLLAGAPNPHCYGRSVFVDGRVDHAQIRYWLERGEDTAGAIDVDTWLQELRTVSPGAYEAVYIQYVEREPGGVHRLSGVDRVRMWHQRTGLGRRTYYARLREGELFVGNLTSPHRNTRITVG